jgi:hypothetical protein
LNIDSNFGFRHSNLLGLEMIDPEIAIARFNRNCAVIGLLFLLVTVGGKTAWYEHKGLPQSPDFPQYFMAGRIALAGAWDSLYPIPLATSRTNPGAPQDSDMRPRYAQLCAESGLSAGANRYIQPPPLALVLIPLALVPAGVSYWLWLMLLALAAWGVGLQAAKIYSISRGHMDRFAGVLTLIICVSPQAFRWVRVGNMSVLVGWLIGYVTIELVRRDSVGSAAALALGTLAKYAVMVLVPLHLILGRWRTLAMSAVMGAMLLLVSLLVMGTGPFHVFFHEIAPTLGRTVLMPENFSLYAFLLRFNGITDERAMPHALEILFRALEAASLAGILLLVWVKRDSVRERPRFVFAAALALVSWLLIFSPIFWEHYHAYLAPFWGWLAAEAVRARGRMVGAVLSILLAYLPVSIFSRQFHLRQLPEPLYSHLLWATVLMGMLAVVSLWTAKTGEA